MMTINHGFSGYVCARVAMPLVERRSPLSPRVIGWAMFLGAMLPDLDIVSRLWGRYVYFSAAWYGHRQASHSLLGTLLLALVGAAVLYSLLGPERGAAPRRVYAWLVACFWCGGLLHIFGDLFTPGLSMPVLWPLPHRWGGLRHIGWFSPYLLWLFLGTFIVEAALQGVRRWLRNGDGAHARVRSNAWLAGGALGAAVWLVYGLAAFRWVQFLLTSHYGGWQQWQAYQRTLLPEAMVSPFTQGVSLLWHWFTG